MPRYLPWSFNPTANEGWSGVVKCSRALLRSWKTASGTPKRVGASADRRAVRAVPGSAKKAPWLRVKGFREQSGEEAVTLCLRLACSSKQAVKITVRVKTEGEEKDVGFHVCKSRGEPEILTALANVNWDFLCHEQSGLISTPGWTNWSQPPFLWGFDQFSKGLHFISLSPKEPWSWDSFLRSSKDVRERIRLRL